MAAGELKRCASMKKSISDPNVRKAVYKAYKGRCFFTGRLLTEEEMVIDHLIPKSKGGPDSFDNYVLTFHDLNLGKSNKFDERLERMQWIVKKVYAPRARKEYEKLCSATTVKLQDDYDEEHKLELKKFKTRIKKIPRLIKIRTEDLFWVEDEKIEVFTELPSIDRSDAYEVLKLLDIYTNMALKDGSDYCIDVWLPSEMRKQLKSIWFSVDGSFFKPVKKTAYYDSKSPEKWAYVYFTKHYIKFLKWRDEINEIMEQIFEIEDANKHKQELRKFCAVFPPPERYFAEIIK